MRCDLENVLRRSDRAEAETERRAHEGRALSILPLLVLGQLCVVQEEGHLLWLLPREAGGRGDGVGEAKCAGCIGHSGGVRGHRRLDLEDQL